MAPKGLIQIMGILPRSPSHWAYMKEILTMVNQASNAFISEPEIEETLDQLKKVNVIGMKKGEEQKGLGYFIRIPDISSNLILPPLAQISSPTIGAGPEKVQNPLTEEIDTI